MEKLKKIILGVLITASFASCVVAVPGYRGGYYGGYGYRGHCHPHHGYGHWR
jgi:hypothetical protein